MNSKILLVCVLVFVLSLTALYIFYEQPVAITLYMYQDKPGIAPEILDIIKDGKMEKYIFESKNYEYRFLKTGPWREYVYVFRGKASWVTLKKIELMYTTHCYNLVTKINPEFTMEEQALLWSKIY